MTSYTNPREDAIVKAFMDQDFLLQNETARRLFHESAEGLPIIDFHNHLDPKAIYEDGNYRNITEAWLGGDHYKWRAMRAHGVSEALITGDGDDYEKFVAWADTVENCIGNPLYHWTHMELQRYFGIEKPLCKATAKEIWEKCNAALQTEAFSVRNLLRRMKCEVLCTTDDPLSDLQWHEKLRDEGFEILVLPTFRPEKAVGIEKEGYGAYIEELSKLTDIHIDGVQSLLLALKARLDFFIEHGCRVSDHSLENTFFVPATEQEVDALMKKRMSGHMLTEEECGKYHGYLYQQLGKLYADHDIVMQMHIGAIRNNSTRFYQRLGVDTGFDSVNDFAFAAQLSALLDGIDQQGQLPKVILYYLNTKDANMLAAMAGNFQSNEQGIRGKVQLGSAWWFGDHKHGMEYQMKCLADVGLLSTFVGMLTDSRSFLSFSRHEYFRRILCNMIGTWVENGEYPWQEAYLMQLVRCISYENSKDYFNFPAG